MECPMLKSAKESFGEKYDKVYKTIGKINQLQKSLTDMFCELGYVAAQQKINVAGENSQQHTHGVIKELDSVINGRGDNTTKVLKCKDVLSRLHTS